MFGNLNKPTFGAAAPNTSFGFGSTSTANANPFGQSQLFGKPATGGFGSPSTSTFGQPANTSLFPSTQAQPTNLFQNANTTFGTPTTQTGFGTSNLFGQQQPSTSGLFNTSSTFGQQNKPTGFGFGTPATQPSLFGQQPQPQQTSSIFQPSTSNLFGGTTAFGGQQATGTVIKFNPVTGTDTMMKNGVAQSINTKHHSITCMKEYENKSFEELRCEDYAANRKGPQQQPGFGAAPFGATASSAPSLFGQPDASKPAFGQTTGFGQTTSTFGQNTSGFGLGAQQQQQGGLFGKPTGFGAPTSSSGSFGFGGTTQTANPFGANQAAKPFGTATQPIFGTTTNTTQQSGFGTGLFGQTTTPNTGSLFGKPAQPTTGFGATQGTTGFSFGPPASTQTSSLFQPNKPLFGQTSTTSGFGQTNTFGATGTTPFGGSFAKQATPAFGTTQQTGFGSNLGGLQTQNTSFFGNTAKPGGLFGNTGSTGLFGNTGTTFQTGTGLGLQQPQQQQSLFPPPEQQSISNLALLTNDPFGDAPHLAGLEPKLKINSPSVSATDPKELKALLDPQKKVDMSHNTKLKVFPFKTIRDSLFDGISPKNSPDGPKQEYVKTNCRRLVLKQKPVTNGESGQPGIPKSDILRRLISPNEGENDGREKPRNDKSLRNESLSSPVKLVSEGTNVSREHSIAVGSQTYNVNSSITLNGSIERNDSPHFSFDEEEAPNPAAGDTPSKSYPCGIVSTRPEYYTLPSLEELTQYVDENGACIVKGFTIGRRGYGNVYFPDEMDVAGLNIDELVHFRYREINVYPDDQKKPPVGQGLNRRAQVTLDNVFPRRADTNTLIKDVSELLQMNFAEKLRKVTVKKGAKFVDYRPETGSWVFKVDHFSRYGFNDSDEESEQNDKDPLKKKKEVVKTLETEKQGQKPGDKKLDKDEEFKKKDKEPEAKMGLGDDIFVEEGDRFIPEDDMLQDEDMIFENDDDFHVVPTEMHLPFDTFKATTNIQVMKSTLFSDDERLSDTGSHISSHISSIRQYFDIPDDIPHLPLITEETVPRKRVVLRPKVDKVYNCGGVEIESGLIKNRCYMDLAMFKSKSFKAGWTKGFEFFTLNAQKGEINGELALNTIDLGLYAKDFDPLKEYLTDALEIVLEESTCDLDANRVPTFKIGRSHTYLEKQTRLFSKLVSKYNDKQSQYLYSIWTLAVALWGPGDDSFTHRRHLLSEWLQANTICDDYPTKDVPKDVFNHLTVFKILDAANLAMDNKFANLALLIAQLSLTNTTKLFLQEQIEMWYKSMVANHMDKDVKRIYLLLSGIPVKDDVNIFENVDWKRAFGMHLWYVCAAGAPLELAIDMYNKAFDEQNYAEAPNPPYRKRYEEDGAFDILYHLLLLYKIRIHRLSSVLNPATHTDDPLDYRLSWLLLQLFLSLNVGLIESSEKDKLCTSFANQLESLGKYEWAIFVLLHLQDNSLKEVLVRRILDRNLPAETDEKTLELQDDLVTKMNIPPEWIHTVKGEKLLLQEKYFSAFNHLAHARLYHKANDVLLEHLIPVLFVNEQYDVIRSMIEAIRDGSRSILHWNNQAGLFLDFLGLQDEVMTMKTEDLLRLQMKLQSISERISAFPVKSDQQKLCIAEMSKRCASVYKELCKKSNSSLFKNSYSEFIETLVMPPDFKQNEAFYMINQLEGLRC